MNNLEPAGALTHVSVPPAALGFVCWLRLLVAARELCSDSETVAASRRDSDDVSVSARLEKAAQISECPELRLLTGFCF